MFDVSAFCHIQSALTLYHFWGLEFVAKQLEQMKISYQPIQTGLPTQEPEC
jgi:hypothetical protein